MSGPVGPVLQNCRAAQAIVEAIREQQPDVGIVRQGSYLRVRANGRCVVTRERIEAWLGEPFELPSDLERIMPSFTGRLHLGSQEVRWD